MSCRQLSSNFKSKTIDKIFKSKTFDRAPAKTYTSMGHKSEAGSSLELKYPNKKSSCILEWSGYNAIRKKQFAHSL